MFLTIFHLYVHVQDFQFIRSGLKISVLITLQRILKNMNAIPVIVKHSYNNRKSRKQNLTRKTISQYPVRSKISCSSEYVSSYFSFVYIHIYIFYPISQRTFNKHCYYNNCGRFSLT